MYKNYDVSTIMGASQGVSYLTVVSNRSEKSRLYFHKSGCVVTCKTA